MPVRVFVDSDVIISSIISQKGAAYLLMRDSRITRFVSDVLIAEVTRVASILNLSQTELRRMVHKQCTKVVLGAKKETLLKRVDAYCRDDNDRHIVAGAKAAKARFLVTYNIKHFNVENIREELGIIVLPPAFLLQYMRSLN